MITEDCATDPLGCVGDVIGGVVGDVAGNAWDRVCKSFADAAVWILNHFAAAFNGFPSPDINSVTGPYAISMWIAGIIAGVLVLGQVIRTAATHDGSAIAHGLVGLGKAVLAILAVRYIANAALIASDEIAKGIVDQSIGDEAKLKAWLTGLFQVQTTTGQAGAATPMSLVLILALVAIVLTLVLWFELLLRNAAILILIATAPIAAVGSISETTKSWWTKLCGAVVQLIILKPIIALCFAVGYGITKGSGGASTPGDIVTLLSGMLVLLVAVVAWPVIAKFFTFASVSFAGGGMAGMLGFAAGRANAGSGTSGINPSQFAQATEARTMASTGANAAGAAESASMMSAGGGAAASGGAASGGAAAGAGAAGAVAGPVGIAAAAGIDVAQRAVNSLTGRMEQMASHADLDGANPHTKPAGYSQYHGSWTGSGSSGAAVEQAPAVEPDHSGSMATMTPPSQAVSMPETFTSEPIPATLPPPAPQQPTYPSPIEEVGR